MSDDRRLAERAFTLVELLAVLAILGILMSIGFVAMRGATRRAKEAETRARMGELATLITAYQNKVGDYPPTSLDSLELKIKAPNQQNAGIEACVAALHHKPYAELANLSDKCLGNTDDDEAAGWSARSGSSRLLEVLDGWDNPIAYFDYKSYGKKGEYRMNEESGGETQNVESRLSEVTGVHANSDSYQLISAGADQKFGTEDDITNFKG